MFEAQSPVGELIVVLLSSGRSLVLLASLKDNYDAIAMRLITKRCIALFNSQLNGLDDEDHA
jgi:hypothetical protein